MKRGRPKLKLTVQVIQVKLRLYEGSDDDLIAFFARIPAKLRAAMVKQAMRSGARVADDAATQDTLTEALDALVN